MINGAFSHHLLADGDGKKSQQTIGNEKKGKKNEHEFQTQTLKCHLYALLVMGLTNALKKTKGISESENFMHTEVCDLLEIAGAGLFMV
jgi:hypothetical protein